MRCKHCGKEIPDDSNFCEFCGKKVAKATGPEGGSKRWIKYAAILLVAVGVGVLIGLILLGRGEVSSTSKATAGYVDLGLPSGTKWRSENESGFYTYDEAVSRFGSNLPSQSQWQELKDYCTWSWTGSGYKVTGTNGNSLVLPAAGVRVSFFSAGLVGTSGFYWSSTAAGSVGAMRLYFDSDGGGLGSFDRREGISVRLVQD